MSDTLLSPDLLQRRAADRHSSVWVAASAGTGKTKVLTDRVLNLLLGGTPPGRILCLTFTKAAAAEMANRLNNKLSHWATANDTELRGDILGITGEAPDPPLYERARQLFARVLDTPGGMRILTIHAFCQSVLRRFPLEAGIPPQFEVMDERSAAELLYEAQLGLLERARAESAGKLGRALADATGQIHELGFIELLQALTGERGRLTRQIDMAGGLEAYLEGVAKRLGVRAEEDEAGWIALLCAEAAFDGGELRRAAREMIASKSVTDQDKGAALAAWLAAGIAERIEGFDAYTGIFLTQKLEPRQRLATKAICAIDGLEASLLAEQARLVAGRERLAAIIVNRATAALTRLAAAFLANYEAEKRRRALLDYDDLILTMRDLLRRPGVAPWVLFKLDGGLDHILIDEAQDTNPDQWEVVAALAEEFFTGLSARDVPRTIFAVGDAKQSIFSFQRADPQAFLAMREHFADKLRVLKSELRLVPLETSFRSARPVLELVDAVFAETAARDGVALDGAEIRHAAHRIGHAGRVELWPPLEPEPAEPPEPWAPPLHQQAEEAPRARLARLITDTVAEWLARQALLPSRGRPIRAGDILVLVRRRGAFVAELVRELKRRGVPVAGTDRMVLTRQLAVMDLMALGRFLLLPDDDLTLATVLKSPLIGLNETQLYELAHGRHGSLWQALRAHPADWAEAAGRTLAKLLARVDFVPPHELYAELLGAGHGRERLIGRLGYEAVDAIDEFLAQTLAFERAHVPSLQGLLHWLDSGEAEIKRDLDQDGRDEVRIMTVHGSKGLQAPIVFLPDTLAVPTRLPPLLWSPDGGVLLWAPRRGAGATLAKSAKALACEKRDQEYRRLLYVALTRAEDRLYICGWKNHQTTSGTASWHELVEHGIARCGKPAPIEVPPGWNQFHRDGHVHLSEQEVQPVPSGGTAAETAGIELPAFATAPPPPEPSPPRPLVASRPSEAEPPTRSPLATEQDQRRFQRGILIHRLMQSLPELAPESAESAARRFLARPAHGLDPAEQDQITQETMAVLRHPDFAPLFGPGSRAEVPVVGLIDGQALSGRLDRLVVTESQVLIVDYKTNRPPPLEIGKVSPAYLVQLRAYRAALERIYPGKRIRTLLLWTDGPRLMEVDAAPGSVP
ncbi:MAG TPA: double-strand break repair helicase AddA [Aliidongia sp.]|nr:double-strand break repair helicase AddA [Aliidongia sp.]